MMAKYEYINKLGKKFNRFVICTYDKDAQYRALLQKDFLEIVNYEESKDVCEFLLSDTFNEIIDFTRKCNNFEIRIDNYIYDVMSDHIRKRFRIYTINHEPILMLATFNDGFIIYNIDKSLEEITTIFNKLKTECIGGNGKVRE